MAVYVRREIAHRSCYTLVERGTEGQMSTKAHACCANATVASREGKERRYGERGVFIVSGELLCQ